MAGKRKKSGLKEVAADLRRDHLMRLERRGRVETTPVELRRQAVREPFYLGDLGLTRRCWHEEPGGEAVPVIRTRKVARLARGER